MKECREKNVGNQCYAWSSSVKQEETYLWLKCQFSKLVTIFGHFFLKYNNLEDLKFDPYFPIFELFFELTLNAMSTTT